MDEKWVMENSNLIYSELTMTLTQIRGLEPPFDKKQSAKMDLNRRLSEILNMFNDELMQRIILKNRTA